VYFVEGPVPLPDIAALTNSNGRFALSAPTSRTYQLGIACEGPAGFLQETTTVEVGVVRSVEFEDRQRVAPGSGLGLLELPEARTWYLLELAGVWATMPRFFLCFLSLFTNVPEGKFCEVGSDS
jgi:hypothetical protein